MNRHRCNTLWSWELRIQGWYILHRHNTNSWAHDALNKKENAPPVIVQQLTRSDTSAKGDKPADQTALSASAIAGVCERTDQLRRKPGRDKAPRAPDTPPVVAAAGLGVPGTLLAFAAASVPSSFSVGGAVVIRRRDVYAVALVLEQHNMSVNDYSR
jgi:hypothetical protein